MVVSWTSCVQVVLSWLPTLLPQALTKKWCVNWSSDPQKSAGSHVAPPPKPLGHRASLQAGNRLGETAARDGRSWREGSGMVQRKGPVSSGSHGKINGKIQEKWMIWLSNNRWLSTKQHAKNNRIIAVTPISTLHTYPSVFKYALGSCYNGSHDGCLPMNSRRPRVHQFLRWWNQALIHPSDST